MERTGKKLNGCMKLDDENIKSVAGGLATPAARRCRSCGNIVIPTVIFSCPVCDAESNFDPPEC